jgi:hypothetical protein
MKSTQLSSNSFFLPLTSLDVCHKRGNSGSRSAELRFLKSGRLNRESTIRLAFRSGVNRAFNLCCNEGCRYGENWAGNRSCNTLESRVLILLYFCAFERKLALECFRLLAP